MTPRPAVILMMGLLGIYSEGQADFKAQQMKFQRVRTAYQERQDSARKLFTDQKLTWPPSDIFLRIFKKEMNLELWAPKPNDDEYCLVKTYRICSGSGGLGPKRRQGDYQVPEGFYQISGFNPVSNFYLSLRVDYPNKSDAILGSKKALGGDIFIHGNCVTIGCIPLDEEIKELYVIAVEVKNRNRRIPVHIFPTQLNDSGMTFLRTYYREQPDLLKFWEGLKPGFDYFETTKKPPKISIDGKGGYHLPESAER